MPAGRPPKSRSPRHPMDGIGVRGRIGTIPMLVLAVSLLLLGGALGAAANPASSRSADTMFDSVTKAWGTRDASGVVGSMNAGMLRLALRTPRISASYRKAQALKTLKSYFSKVSEIVLKDVTPRTQEPPAGHQVRIYDYTYRPKGRDTQATRLQITLKAVGRTGWELIAITETSRPRPR